MKTTINFFMLTLFMTAFQSQATVKLTVADGNWFDPAVWSPAGVPVSEDTVIIDHYIIADDSVYFDASLLLLNSNGYIDSWYLFSFDGNLTNYGIIDSEEIHLVGSETTLNYGGIDVGKITSGNDFFSNYADLNADTIVAADVNFENHGMIDCLHFIWAGEGFDNMGTLAVQDNCTLGEPANNHAGAIIYADTIIVGSTMDNSGDMGGVYMVIGEDFTNNLSGMIAIDDITFGGDNTINNGSVVCENLTTGGITVTGTTGVFCISDCWVNLADLTGSIDFCDDTPSGTCDIQMGTIGPNVTFCINGTCTAGTESETKPAKLSIYPNPAKSQINVEVTNIETSFGLQIITLDGKVVLVDEYETGSNCLVDISGISSGNYVCMILYSGQVIQKKLVIQ